MLRRVGYVLSATIGIAVASLAAGQRQPTADPPPPAGSAGLTGRVIASDGGRPIRRAQVRLYGLSASQADPNRVQVWRRVETDATGRFDIADLPAGSYSIDVEPMNGFAKLPAPREMTLTDGQTRQVTIRLERAGAIEGRVLDENGDGVLGAQVHAVRRVDLAGHIKLASPVAWADTNDLGEFRIYNLRPGDYYVLATYTPPNPGWHGIQNEREIDSARRWGYANTYYPRSPTLRNARSVVVRAGRDTERVNFTLSTIRLARVSVHPLSSAGVPLDRDAQMTLTRHDDVYLTYSTRQTSRREDGTFVFDDVTPGDYYLIVATARMEEAAYVNVTVADQDLSLNVQTNAGASVTGRVIVDGQPFNQYARYAAPGHANVTVSASRPLEKYGPAYENVQLAQVRGTDRFELRGLRGPMVLSAGIGIGTLVSMRRPGQEIAGKTLEFVGTETIDDVVVELTMKVAELDVTVTGTNSPDEPEPVLVILFSEDSSRRHHGHLAFARTTASRTPPTTRLIRNVPGRYRIVAIHDFDISNPTEAGLLEKLRPYSVPITLVAGQPAKITIPVAKPTR